MAVIIAAAGFATRPGAEGESSADRPQGQAAQEGAIAAMHAEASGTAAAPAWEAAPDWAEAAEVLEPRGVPAGDAPADVLEVLEGTASFYASSLAGRRTASGARYNPRELVAAHRHLPFGTVLRVTNPANDRAVEVRVIDRGPFTRGRVIDLSRRAAEEIGIIRRGHAPVRIEVLSYGS